MLYDGLYTFVMRVATMGVAVVLGILTARLLGPTGKGLYAMPTVEAGLVATAFAGLSSATSFFLLNRRAGRNIIAPAIWCALAFVAGASVAVLAIAAIGHALWAAPAAIASLPASAAANVATGYVVGIKRIRYATTLTFATTLTTLALMAIGLFVVARTPLVAIVIWIAATSLVGAVALIAVVVHSRTLERGEPVDRRSYVRMALKVGATGLVSLLNYRADLYIVAAFLTPADLGLYSVAVSAAEMLLVPTQVAALVTSPHIGGLDHASAVRLAARCVRNNLLIASSVCLVFLILAPFVVKLLYGDAFLGLVPSLRILLVGVVALALGSPISNYYTLKLGKPEIPLVLSGLSAAICIACAVVLVPHIGIAGAALASTIAYVAGQGLGIAYFSRVAHVGTRAILIPTRDDFRIYFDFAMGKLRG